MSPTAKQSTKFMIQRNSALAELEFAYVRGCAAGREDQGRGLVMLCPEQKVW